MVPDLMRVLSLLLLLAQCEPMYPLDAWPKGLTKAHWFEIQHIQSSSQPCNRAMSGVNNYTQHCKPANAFLHDSFQNVATACDLPNIICKNGEMNCHQSGKPVNSTHCRLTAGKYPHCRYSEEAQYKFFVVACDPPEKTDPPYQLVPVHLDKLI
ncbi:ribonuclease K6-like [Thomomys bottae]